MKPRISIIIPAMLGYDSVVAAIDVWEAQSSRSSLELIVLCPSAPDHSVPAGQTILETGSLLLHEARAAGVRKAAADFIMFAEDHCLPDPDCVEMLIERIQEPWDAVGTALRAGNAQWAITRAAFLISYGQWILPVSGPISHLPGHNAVLRKEMLLEMGQELEDELLFASFLMRRLRLEGRSFFVEAKARMKHFDPPTWKRSLGIFYMIGQGCGAIRLDGYSVVARALYGLLFPVVVARHFARALLCYIRAGRRAGMGIATLATSGILAGVWGCGEVVGAWRGVRRVAPDFWTTEVKPVSKAQSATPARPGVVADMS